MERLSYCALNQTQFRHYRSDARQLKLCTVTTYTLSKDSYIIHITPLDLSEPKALGHDTHRLQSLS
jgi:hypothetical protein